MDKSQLNKQARHYYRRFYTLMGVAVVVMLMVLTGSVVLGDSVRDTLLRRVDERLGSAQTIITAGGGWLADSILLQPQLQHAHGYLLAEGFVASAGRMLPVMVWGTDEDSLTEGEALVNETLGRMLKGAGSFVVHLPSSNMVPSGSLFVTQQYTTTLRLSVRGVKTAAQGGDRWLHNEQMRRMNVFVSRQEMAKRMGAERRVNLILSDDFLSVEDFSRCWNPAYSGMRWQGADTVCVTSQRVFLPQQVVEALQPTEVYEAYFVNRLSALSAHGARGREGGLHEAEEDCTVPYSFVTATSRLRGDEAVLTDVAARRTGVGVGDSVEMEYYVAKGLKQLSTRTHRFVVSGILPMEQVAHDARLKADFPGLSDVKRCTDWDSDLPIDMSRITREDEAYWQEYRQTPKALVAWEAVRDDWSNAYGVATTLCLDGTSPAISRNDSTGATAIHAQWITPSMMGVTVMSPCEESLRLAAGGTDFGALFLALAFFILVSGILLLLTPLSEMYHLRRNELQLYLQLGFALRDVRLMLFRQALPVLLLASPVGVLAGCMYAAFSLWLLSGAWRGATHTDGFLLSIHPLSLLLVWLAGLAVGALLLWWAVPMKMMKSLSPAWCHDVSAPSATASGHARFLSGTWLRRIADGGVLLLFLVLIALNFCCFHSMLLFVLCGLLWMVCAANFGRWLLVAKNNRSARPFSQSMLWLTALTAHLPRHRIAFWMLGTGIFMVFSVGLNRPGLDHSSNASTGGYAMYADCRVPLHYDLNSPDVRRHLQLDDLPPEVRFLQLSLHREDEASCLNLNKVATPSVLSMDVAAMPAFGIDTAVFAGVSADVVPVVLDEEALMWSVQKQVGDTLQYAASDGSTVQVLIVGTYPVGILHGHVLMPSQHFSRLWPEENGTSVLLSTHDVSQLLATALSDYGIDAMGVEERMAQFFEVVDTYLSIFMALGGLGLLLGLVGLVIIIRKYLAARRHEVALYSALGFPTKEIVHQFRMENLLPVLYAIGTGALGSLISISASVSAVGPDTWLWAGALLLFLLSVAIVFINHIIHPKTIGT